MGNNALWRITLLQFIDGHFFKFCIWLDDRKGIWPVNCSDNPQRYFFEGSSAGDLA